MPRGDGRRRILSEALNLFADRGFDAVSTSDIAKAAGTAQSVVLHHFNTKDELWQQSMRQLFERIDARHLFETESYKDLTTVDQFKVLLRRFVLASARVPQLGRVIVREGLNGGPRLSWLICELAKPQYDLFIRPIKEMQARGLLSDWDPVALTITLHSAGSTIFNMAHLGDQLSDRDPFTATAIQQQADMLVAMVFGGLARTTD